MRSATTGKLLAVTTLLALFATGCATRIGPTFRLEFMQPVYDAHSRNKIVCVPTLVGNMIGGSVGYLSYLSLIPMLYILDNSTITAAATLTVLGAPMLIGGAAIGTPFIPFSYLSPEDPCEWNT